ncbi:Apolipoprotein D [Frankliniella fusca]|uniref:Apolipoprotein D n=1 Tax=Frankliniella fusca TaxID=407009 RepID=A0AAE1LQ25_9NEOP|nr:Apolipoprotein D [Frankliniella fusca]
MTSVPPVVVVLLAAWLLAATGGHHHDLPTEAPGHETESSTISWATVTGTETDPSGTTCPCDTSTTSAPEDFDVDVSRLTSSVTWWHVKRLNIPAPSALSLCIWAQTLAIPGDAESLGVNVFGSSITELQCTKITVCMFECSKAGNDEPESFTIVVLGTNYETYLVVGVECKISMNTYAAKYWVVFTSSPGGLRPEDANKVERMLLWVTDTEGNDVTMSDAGQDCPVHPDVTDPPSSASSPDTTTDLSTPQTTTPHIDPITAVPVIVLCASKSYMQDFDMERYSGSWHDIMVTKSFKPPPSPCTTHLFASASNAMTYFEKDYDIRAASYTLKQGFAEPLGPISRGMFAVILPPRGPLKETRVMKYSIVETDYDEYAVVMDCRENHMIGEQKVRVLGRRYWLGAAAHERVTRVLQVLGVNNPGTMVQIDTRPCLPDVCLRRGPAMPDFDARQFAGAWHLVRWLDVPAGPLPECVTYLNAAAVNASIFLHVSDAHDSFSRRAVQEALPVDRLTGEGRYVVRGHLSQPTTHFDVIHAVYNSWALVSLCTEPDEVSPGRTAHNSLRILSRSRDPSKFPEEEVAQTLTKLDLDLTNFERILYSSNVCDPVKCPLDIPAMDRFDPTKFQGVWVVLEETATDVTTGFCTRHRIKRGRLNRMTLDVFQYNSDGESVSNRTYDLDSQHPSEGRYMASDMLESHRDIFEYYWVLDTDYKEFAVVYSCSDHSGGWENARTWVLGRSTVGLGHASTMRVMDVLANSYVDTRRLREVDHQIAPCPPHHLPDDDGWPVPGDGSGGGSRLAARGGLLVLCAAALAFAGVHARLGVGLRGLGLSTAAAPPGTPAGSDSSPCALAAADNDSPAGGGCSPSADSPHDEPVERTEKSRFLIRAHSRDRSFSADRLTGPTGLVSQPIGGATDWEPVRPDCTQPQGLKRGAESRE